MSFGAMLRKRRNEREMSMSGLARALDVSSVYLRAVELGLQPPMVRSRILQAAAALETDPEPLLIAAAKERGSFELPAERCSSLHRRVGAALSARWARLSEGELQQIEGVLGVRSPTP